MTTETMRSKLGEAELDAPEEARRFYGKYQAGFLQGARWTLDRWWRATALVPVPASPDGLDRAEVIEALWGACDCPYHGQDDAHKKVLGNHQPYCNVAREPIHSLLARLLAESGGTA